MGKLDRSVEAHESYGQALFCRTQSTPPASFYGSSIRCSSYVILYISRSELHRSHGACDHYMGAEELISVRFSPNQFAQLLTQMNVGSGVPCTIERVGGKKAGEPPFINKQVQFNEEYKQDMEDLAQQYRDAIEEEDGEIAKAIKGLSPS